MPGIGGASALASVPAAPRKAAPTKFTGSSSKRKWLLPLALIVIGGLAYAGWKLYQPAKLPGGFASSNGRIEATEIDVATKLAGRILDELVDEGNLVNAGQIVAHMDIETLQAQRRAAVAKLGMAKSAEIRRGASWRIAKARRRRTRPSWRSARPISTSRQGSSSAAGDWLARVPCRRRISIRSALVSIVPRQPSAPPRRM